VCALLHLSYRSSCIASAQLPSTTWIPSPRSASRRQHSSPRLWTRLFFSQPLCHCRLNFLSHVSSCVAFDICEPLFNHTQKPTFRLTCGSTFHLLVSPCVMVRPWHRKSARHWQDGTLPVPKFPSRTEEAHTRCRVFATAPVSRTCSTRQRLVPFAGRYKI